MKKRRTEEQTVSKLRKKLDKVFSLYIRQRDGAVCFTCGAKKTVKTVHCGHFISRSHNATRFDERNCHAQCVGCNIFKSGNMHEYSARLIEKYGVIAFNDLIALGRTTKQFTPLELRTMIAYYESKVKNDQ